MTRVHRDITRFACKIHARKIRTRPWSMVSSTPLVPINLVAFSRSINGVRFTHDKVTIIQVSTRDTLVFNLYLHNDAMHHHTLYRTGRGRFHIFVPPRLLELHSIYIYIWWVFHAAGDTEVTHDRLHARLINNFVYARSYEVEIKNGRNEKRSTVYTLLTFGK